jgi:hypothetical protein
MSLLKAARTAQEILVAEFEWNFDDTMVNTAGNTVDFGAANAGGAAGAFDVIKLPPGAIVVGGSLTVTTAFDTAGYDIIVGDSADTNRYFETADLKALSTSALLVPGFRNPTGLDIRLTFGSDDACTTGVASLRVHYIIDNRTTAVNAGPA